MITFFKKKDEYAWMSNFAPYGFRYKGRSYATVEHAFQSVKFEQHAPEYAEKIRQASTPAKAKTLGRSRKYRINDNWNEKRVHVMHKLLCAKLGANPELIEKLHATGDEEIGEANPFDYFWGLGESGTGKNVMGKLWVSIREDLRT